MNAVLRYGTIISILAIIVGGLTYFQGDRLREVSPAFWDVPQHFQNFHRENNRWHRLDATLKSQDLRRAEIHKIVQAICKEEIGLGEAARRVKALETERHLPPLRWPLVPKEKWPEELYACLLEQVAFELSDDPAKAALVKRLEKEMKEQFPLARIELPPSIEPKVKKAGNGGAVLIPIKSHD